MMPQYSLLSTVVVFQLSFFSLMQNFNCLIDKTFVFILLRNIEELQEQNQKLLTVVRKLSDDKESQEDTITSKTG